MEKNKSLLHDVATKSECKIALFLNALEKSVSSIE